MIPPSPQHSSPLPVASKASSGVRATDPSRVRSREFPASWELLWRSLRWSARQPVVFPLSPDLEVDYAKTRVGSFHKQLAPAINVTITALALFPVVAWLFPAIVNPIPFQSLAMALNAEIALWLLSRSISRLRTLQLIALISFVIPLVLFFSYFVLNLSYYLIVIFVMGLVLPWNGAEAILISVPPILAFYGAHGRALELTGLGDDTVVFLLSIVTVSRLQFREERERRRRFTIESEATESRKAIRESLEVAARIHAELISPDLDTPVLSSRVLYEPMELLGGDFVQTHEISRHRIAMIMADVTGHGVPAALMVNRMHDRAAELMVEGAAPGEAARGLNTFITRAFEGTGMLMSAIWIEFDAEAGTLTWVNHGHPPALLISPHDLSVHRLHGHASFMGVDWGRSVLAETISVRPGDLLVAYTDGLIEMPAGSGPNGIPLGITGLSEGLVEAIRKTGRAASADDVIRALRKLIRAKRHGDAQDDLLAVAWKLGDAGGGGISTRPAGLKWHGGHGARGVLSTNKPG